VRLRALRKAAGLSQAELGKRVGLTDRMVSHYEVGRYTPSLDTLDRLAEVLAIPADARAELVDQVAELAVEVRSLRARLRQVGERAVQGDVGAGEQAARVIWVYQSAVVPGLLQTADYMRSMAPLLLPELRDDLDGLVAGRAERQQILYDRTRSLRFLVHESALRARLAPVSVLRGQLDRLVALIRALPHVEVRLLPFTTTLPAWTVTPFDIVDDHVQVELLTSSVALTDPREVDLYRDRFENLWAVAAAGDDVLSLLRDIDAWLAGLAE
jgi:transcriptional regulator with XRE-family HTH domain